MVIDGGAPRKLDSVDPDVARTALGSETSLHSRASTYMVSDEGLEKGLPGDHESPVGR